MAHPISGPVPIEKFRELVSAPCGEAAKVIRKFDPHWGAPEGAKLKWGITFSAEIEGYAVVEATTREEAEKIALDGKIEWDEPTKFDISVEDVEPVS